MKPDPLLALAGIPLNPYRPVLVGNHRPLLQNLSRRSKLLHAAALPDDAILLQDLHWTADCFALEARPETEIGALVLLRFALDRMEIQGEGVLLLTTRAWQTVSQREEARHVWAVLTVATDTLVWFAKAHTTHWQLAPSPACPDLAAAASAAHQLRAHRLRLRTGAEASDLLHAEATVKLWHVAQQEAARTTPHHHLFLDAAGFVQFELSAFDQHSQRLPAATVQRLRSLTGQRPVQLVVMKESRETLQWALTGSDWSVHPDLPPVVARALAEFQHTRAPLYPLPPLQRLAFLDEVAEITCCDSLYLPGTSQPVFRSGRPYPIAARAIAVARVGSKLNLHGVAEAVRWDGQQTAFWLTAENGCAYCFADESLRAASVTVRRPGSATPVRIDFTLPELVQHFTVPAVPDVATLFPAQYQANLKQLAELEALVNA